jgi:hypothetical protein
MSKGTNDEATVSCGRARKNFHALTGPAATSRALPIGEKLGAAERAATERHLQTCKRCRREYRLFALGNAAINAAAAPEAVMPGEDFFKAVRAQIARGQRPPAAERADESWSAALLVTARQLIPAMAMLLLLIIGATLLWNSSPAKVNLPTAQNQIPRRERILLNDVYDVPAPTADDVLETLVAVEEKDNNGK